MNFFNEEFKVNFFKENFGKKYLFKPGIINNYNNIMNLSILNNMLSLNNIWNNKNFLMALDRKPISYIDFSSQHIDISGNNLRPDINKVQNLISKGASIILNDIERHNPEISALANFFQKITHGRCQGNLYFSMESHQAFGPHCDEHDVFAIHFEGEKIWNIYQNIERSPINHPAFKHSAEERIKKAGKIIDQVTLKPGDLLYIPRGQYHDALASKDGAIHIAFGLTYFKPIDLMSTIWDRLVLNEFMRDDINALSNSKELKVVLNKFSNELSKIIKNDETVKILSTSLKNWPYEIKNYALKEIISEGRKYSISKSITLNKKGSDFYLSNGKDNVSVPKEFVILTQFIFQKKVFTYKSIVSNFQNIPTQTIQDCIKQLKNMQVII